jgi:hypothetical protein
MDRGRVRDAAYTPIPAVDGIPRHRDVHARVAHPMRLDPWPSVSS